MLIQRELYVKQLAMKMNNGMIKVITGIRRCGKSFLLFQLFVTYLKEQGIKENQIVRIPLDDDDYAEYRDPEKLYQYIKENTADRKIRYYILIDEAQFAISKEEMRNNDKPVRLYGVLNGLLRKNNVDVYVTGSNSKFLSSDVMTEFRGRGDEVHIAPLSFSEFMSVYHGDKYDGWQEYSMYGGLPHIFEEKSETEKSNYLKKLNTEIYLRDIAERYEIQSPLGMEELMKTLASSIGSLANAQKIADTFASNGQKGVSMPTISNYIRYLLESFVIEKSERYDIKGRKYISTPAKYYYTDMGLRNALLNFRQYEETHIMENIIYNELIYRGYNVDVGVVGLSQRVAGKQKHMQLEVDFVANLGSRRYYIQSAYAIPDEEKMKKVQNSLIHIPDSFRKIIVVHGNTPLWHNEQGVTIMNIYDFLLNPGSLDL